MAEEPELLEIHEEEEGGPVKSFLEHLEDLRWVLIKCVATAGVAMLACFFAGNYVVKVLEWPLKRAPVEKIGKEQRVRVLFGTNQLGAFIVGTNEALTSLAGTNQFVRLEIVPIRVEDKTVLGVNVQAESTPPPGKDLPVDITTLGPAAAFVVATKVAFYGGLVISSPLLIIFIGQFVFPALKMREKKYV